MSISSRIEFTPEQAERGNFVIGLLKVWRDGGKSWHGVYLSGAGGVGKTEIARFVAEQARLKRWQVFETSALEASLEAQASHKKNAEARTPHEMIQEVKKSKLVLLDDMGRDRTEYSRDVIFALLDTALSSGAFVIITSNKTPVDLAAHYAGDDGLKSRLSSLRLIEFPATMRNWRRPSKD